MELGSTGVSVVFLQNTAYQHLAVRTRKEHRIRLQGALMHQGLRPYLAQNALIELSLPSFHFDQDSTILQQKYEKRGTCAGDFSSQTLKASTHFFQSLRAIHFTLYADVPDSSREEHLHIKSASSLGLKVTRSCFKRTINRKAADQLVCMNMSSDDHHIDRNHLQIRPPAENTPALSLLTDFTLKKNQFPEKLK